MACGVFAGLSFWILPSPRCGVQNHAAAETTATTKPVGLWTRLDVSGTFLGVAGMVLFNFAFNQAPIVSWTTPYTYFLLVMGVMLLLAFIAHERRATHPLVPTAQLSTMTAFVLGCTAMGWACFSIWCYYAFSFLQELRGWSPLLASAGFSPAPLMGLIASLLTGYSFGRKVKPQLILLGSMCAFFPGSSLWATAPVGQSYWLNSFFGILVMPFRNGYEQPGGVDLVE